MPTYEYACTSCGEHVDVVQSFSDDPLTTCPSCGGPLRKVFAPVGIVLKGSGFYKTDSRTSGKGGRSGAGRGDGDGPPSGSDGAKEGAAAGGGDKGSAADKNGKTPGTKESGGSAGGGGSSTGDTTPAAAASS